MAKYLTVAQLEAQFDTMLRSLKALAEEKILEPVNLIAEQAKAIADSVRRDADNGVFDGVPGERGPKGDRGERGEAGAVATVNGRSGTVVLSAADVGAKAADWNPETSNRNLLDNPWFTVHQRGTGIMASGGYVTDRWMAPEGSDPVNVSDGCLIIGAAGDIRQILEPELVSTLTGRIVTLSLDVGITRTVCTDTFVFPESAGSEEFDLLTGFKAALIRTDTQTCVRIYGDTASDYGRVNAVKLELGSVSTLRYDTKPEESTELLKCQRYFRRIRSNNFPHIVPGVTGYASGTTNVRFSLLFPTTMRINPSISFSDISSFSLLDAAGTKHALPASTAITVANAFTDENGEAMGLRFTPTSDAHGYAVNTPLWLISSGPYTIDLSADL